ncbi:hypothetical protein Bca4012_068143 [Brassica carinata]
MSLWDKTSFHTLAVAAAPGDGGGAAAAVEEQTEFDVVINEVPSNVRIAVIKALGVEGSQGADRRVAEEVKEDVTKDEAEEAKKQLEEAGAKVSIA